MKTSSTVICLFEDVQVVDHALLAKHQHQHQHDQDVDVDWGRTGIAFANNNANANANAIKMWQDIPLEVDSDAIYVAGKYKLKWKDVTSVFVDLEEGVVAISNSSRSSSDKTSYNDADIELQDASFANTNTNTSRKEYSVRATLTQDPRRHHMMKTTTTTLPAAWMAFGKFVRRKWEKRQAKLHRRLRQQEEAHMNEVQALQMQKKKSFQQRRKVSSTHKALRFLNKNLANIKEWEDSDDETFNRRSHKVLLQERKQEEQDQKQERQEKLQLTEGTEELSTLHEEIQSDNEGEVETSFTETSSDLDVEPIKLKKKENKDNLLTTTKTKTIGDRKGKNLKRRSRRVVEEKDSDDDDFWGSTETITSETMPSSKMTSTSRVVTPASRTLKHVLQDDDDDDNDNEEDEKAAKENAIKNMAPLTSYFTAKSNQIGTKKKIVRNTITSTSTTKKMPSKIKDGSETLIVSGKHDDSSKKKKDEFAIETTTGTAEASAPKSMSNFFAPRAAPPRNSKKAPSLDMKAQTPQNKAQPDTNDAQSDDVVGNTDDDTVMATPPPESPKTPPHFKPSTQNHKPADASETMGLIDEKFISPTQEIMASPLPDRMSGRRKRGFFGTKPPSSARASNSSAIKALSMADTIDNYDRPASGHSHRSPSASPVRKRLALSASKLSPMTTSPAKSSPAVSPSIAPPKYRGLRNLGNTCYLNASLQMLFSLPAFVQSLNPFTKKGHALVDSFCRTFQQVIHPEEQSRMTAASARPLKIAIDEITDKFRGYQQRDAHEFLGDLIDQVHDEIKTEEGASMHDLLPTDDFFKLNVQVCLQCKSCGYSRSKEEMYRCISVDIDTFQSGKDECSPSKPSVEQCLKKFFQPEDRELNCEKCDIGTEATQTMRILSRPRSLLIHLKRFKLVETQVEKTSSISYKKNRAAVGLNDSLSLDAFLAKDISNSHLSSNYSLHSVVHHIGNTADSGHYTADAVRQSISKESKTSQWVSYDDSTTSETSVEKVRQAVQSKRTAYMMLYVNEQ